MNNSVKQKNFLLSILLIFALLGQANSAASFKSETKESVEPILFQNMTWRSIGPAIMGGRMVDIEAVSGKPHIIYLGTASSGIWKSVNGGITFEPIFDSQPVHAIGDIALAPSNPNIIWVGTGERNCRDSISAGNGVYKSLDGGASWLHMGLENTRFISRVVIHPANPDLAYVAAIGHIWGPSKDRAVYMTTDGGKTWQQVLYVDEETGASDLDIDPSNPNILYAGMWTFQRSPWTHRSGSEKGGVFKSTDGGITWKKLTQGLPTLIGRIGVKVAPSNPNVVYAIMECKEGTLYRSNNKGENWEKVSQDWSIVMRGFYYAELHVDPQDENHVYALANGFYVSSDGGKIFRSIHSGLHGDHHGMWIDPLDPNYMISGNDGGMGISYDGDKTWDRINTMPHGQFYRLAVDLESPFYHVAGGLQDNSTWIGPARSRCALGILNDDWFTYCGGDGFYPVIHREKSNLMICEGQCGRMERIDLRTGMSQNIMPSPFPSQAIPAKDLPYRFAWNTPIVASPHDSSTIYLGGNVLFRSTNFGTDWEIISPDLTTNNPEKLKEAGGPIAIEGTGAEYHCTIRTISESPVKKDIIWVGTDDGLIHVSQDGGKTWTNVTKNVTGLLPEGYISQVEASHAIAGVAYMTSDRHMLDDVHPYVFKTEDFGKTWVNITDNLPANTWVHVIREDPRNPQVLYVGTEYGIFVSFTGGNNWVPLKMKNLPTVSVRDIIIHPEANDLILGTHGRSIYILDDITFFQQLSQDTLNADAYLFNPRKAWRYEIVRNKVTTGGSKAFQGTNPDYGALITYYLRASTSEKTPVKIQIFDAKGNLVKEMIGTKHAGINRVPWPLQYEGPVLRNPERAHESGSIRESPGPQALPGEYTIKLIVGSTEMSKKLQVVMDPLIELKEYDLQVQLAKAIELREMLSSLNLSLRALDSLESQIKNLQQTIKQGKGIPNSVAEAIANLLQKSLYIREHMSIEGRNYNWTPGYIYGKVSSLFSIINDTNATPTRHQLEFLETIKGEYQETLQRVNKLIADDVPVLNRLLQKQNLPSLSIGNRINFQ